ncbi:MAG: DUF1186 domain-containing protein [Aestuariivirga sp.]
MTLDEILEAFVKPHAFPEEAIAAADARRAELVQAFLDKIAEWTEDRGYPKDQYYDLAAIAINLLAEWREPSAFKPVLRFLATPQSRELLGDGITEDGQMLLVRLYDGDRGALENLVLDETADEYVREQAIEAYVRLTQDGEIPRDDARAFVERLFAQLPRKPNYVWIAVINATSSLAFADLSAEVKRLFDENVADITVMGYNHFEADLREAEAGGYPGRRNQGSPVEEMRRWIYSGDEWEPSKDRLTIDEMLGLALAEHSPAINEFRDTGRNDPCPCGSGKKFKKCCLPKVEAGEM